MIREASITDTSALQGLLIQLGYPGLDETGVTQKILDYKQDQYMLLVTEDAGHLSGFIALHAFNILHSEGKIGRIMAFCVDEAVRGQGIGTALMDAAEGWFASQGCTKLEVTSNERRTATHAFYKNKGWTEDSRRFVKYLKTT